MALTAYPTTYVNSPGAGTFSLASLTRNTSPGATAATPPTVAAPPTPKPATDYQSLLQNDPLLGSTLSGINASGLANRGSLLAQLQRAIGQYGATPGLAGLSGDAAGLIGEAIDPTTAALAARNTQAGTSTVAGLRRVYDTAQQASTADLAARGILRSGAYGQHSAENLQNYSQAGYQADQQLLDYLQGLYSGYLQQQDTLRGQGVAASQDALGRLIQQIQAGLIGGGASTPPPAPAGVTAPIPGFPATVNPDQADPYRAALAFAGASRRPVAI